MTYNEAKKKFADDLKMYLDERTTESKSNALSSMIYLADNYMNDLEEEYGDNLFLTDIGTLRLATQIFSLLIKPIRCGIILPREVIFDA